jgi:hypothetical protein
LPTGNCDLKKDRLPSSEERPYFDDWPILTEALCA